MAQLPYPLQSWIPYKADVKDGQVFCRWLNTFNKPYAEPFFDETILKCVSLNTKGYQFLSTGDLNTLEEWSAHADHINPAAFIFHISRCGSTLVSQLLGMNEQNISLAEVPFFDDILRLPFHTDDIDSLKAGQLLKTALKFYGQKRNGNEKDLFIKTDSWHILFYKHIRQLYPDVPFVFLYRSPDEVFNSHRKRRGIQAVPGLIEPELFGFDKDEVKQMNLDNYTAKVIERYFECYLEIIGKDQLSLFLDYKEGIIPIIKKIASFTGTTITDEELSDMEARTRYHSKYPGEVFSEKQPPAETEYLEKAFELYNELGKLAG